MKTRILHRPIELLERRTLFAVTATPLVTFNGANGDTPHTIVQDNSGDLVGITLSGGANNFGEIFRLPDGASPQLEILYSFTDGVEGRSPISLAMNSSGDIFGTTELGGANNVGTLFKLAAGSNTIEKLLDLTSTAPSQSEVATASAKLAPFTDPAGNLYGVITPGTVFRIAAGTSTIEQLDFVQGNVNDLTLDPSGNLFGTTFLGGNDGFGTIFEIPVGTTTANTIATFSPAVGTVPNGLVIDSAGNLYGSTQGGGANGFGGVFKVAQGSSTIELLGSFDGTNGNQPGGKPVLDDHGNLFGITRQGGNNDSGTLYKLPAGSNTILPVYLFGLNEATIPAFSSSFGDIQQPIVKQVEAGLDPAGWHYDYPPPPPGSPEAANADIPADDGIRLGLPIGGPPALTAAAREFRPPVAAADDAQKFGELIQFEAALALGTQFTVTITGNVPPSAVGGGSARLPIKVNIKNDGDQAVTKSSSTVKLFLSPDGQIDGETAIVSISPKLSLKPGQAKTFSLKVNSIPDVAEDTYQIIAQVTDPANNIFEGTGPSIAIAPPFVRAAVSGFNPVKTAATAGKRATLSLRLANNGNISASGLVAATIYLTTDPAGAGGQNVSVRPLRVKLKPAASRAYRINLTVPADQLAGAYYVRLALNVGAIGDQNSVNGLALTTIPLNVI